MEAFRFYSPIWFALAPMALIAVYWAFHPKLRAAAVFSSLADLKNLPVSTAQRIRRILPYAYGLGLVLLIGALARPQRGQSESMRHTEGIAIELVVDVSGSMDALDFQLDDQAISRINAVKHVVKDFILGSKESELAGRPNDLIGLIAFGGFADSKCPLTLDHGALTDIVESVQIAKAVKDSHGKIINAAGWQEEQATAIGDGLALGADRLRGSNAKSKVMILLTDGDNNAGVVEPHEAAKIAKELGIKVYTICVGQNNPAPFPMEDDFGNRVLVPQVFPIDEDLLRDIANIAGGKYFHATKSAKALADVYAEIDRLEKSKVEQSNYTEYTELYHWLALPGVGLLLSVGFLNMTRFRSLP